jgi:hypothetical protein
LYTATELTGTITAHSLPPLPASPKLLSVTSTLRPQAGESLGNSAAAELLLALPPKVGGGGRRGRSSDGSRNYLKPFLYATNRNNPSPEGDPVTIFSLEHPATPTFRGEVYTGLRYLRGAAFGGEDRRYIIMGAMLGGDMKIYERFEEGRALMEIAALPDIEGPTGFLWLRQEECTADS